jgi:cytochrome c oxidase subunit 4
MEMPVDASHAEGKHKHLGPAQYVLIWVALMILTAITLAVWKTHLSLGLRVGAALGIATVKAALVALFFMHLWDHGGATRLVLATSMMFVVLLIGLTLADNMTRFPYANPPFSSTQADVPFVDAAPPPILPAPPARTAPAGPSPR